MNPLFGILDHNQDVQPILQPTTAMPMVPQPAKPYEDYPLTPHPCGQWCKKVRGKLRYFGVLSDSDAALRKYLDQKDDLLAGRKPSNRNTAKITRPPKPYKGFPLTAHPSGQWCKKVRGKVRYFGVWDDPQAALNKYLDQKDELLAGREPTNGDGISVRDLVNRFLTAKQRRVDSGELTAASWSDYNATCRKVLEVFGKNRLVHTLRPIDFEELRASFAKTHGPVRLCKDVTCARMLFRHAQNFDVLVNFGDGFKKPSKLTLRKLRQERGAKMFAAPQIRKLIQAADIQLKAMIYLGINCGFGNNDCAMLTKGAIKGEWVEFPRPKTGILRRCPLWPATRKALKVALAARPTPKNPAHEDRVFIMPLGHSWEPRWVKDNPISREFAKLLKSMGLNGRAGVGFYALRHTFQTIGEKCADKDAVRAIMGHAEAPGDMSAVYNEEAVEDARLKAVSEHVHAWLKSR